MAASTTVFTSSFFQTYPSVNAFDDAAFSWPAVTNMISSTRLHISTTSFLISPIICHNFSVLGSTSYTITINVPVVYMTQGAMILMWA
jgi:hypothetical protein